MLKLEDVYDVTIVKDGQEAYDMVKTNMEEGKQFNLIFMDIQVCCTPGVTKSVIHTNCCYRCRS
jgi:osomolarity two-component system sensor histidine kinase SLN1